MNKKIIAFLIMGFIIISLSGCAKIFGEKAQSFSDEALKTAEAEGEDIVVSTPTQQTSETQVPPTVEPNKYDEFYDFMNLDAGFPNGIIPYNVDKNWNKKQWYLFEKNQIENSKDKEIFVDEHTMRVTVEIKLNIKEREKFFKTSAYQTIIAMGWKDASQYTYNVEISPGVFEERVSRETLSDFFISFEKSRDGYSRGQSIEEALNVIRKIMENKNTGNAYLQVDSTPA